MNLLEKYIAENGALQKLKAKLPAELAEYLMGLDTLAGLLAEASAAEGNSQEPAHIWAVQESLFRLFSNKLEMFELLPMGELYVLHRSLSVETCVDCLVSLRAFEYRVSIKIGRNEADGPEEEETGLRQTFGDHLCIPCAANRVNDYHADDLIMEPVLEYLASTHWDPARSTAIDLTDLRHAELSILETSYELFDRQEQDERDICKVLTLLIWSLPPEKVGLVLGITKPGVERYLDKFDLEWGPAYVFWKPRLHVARLLVEESSPPCVDYLPENQELILKIFGYTHDPNNSQPLRDWMSGLPWNQNTPISEILGKVFAFIQEQGTSVWDVPFDEVQF